MYRHKLLIANPMINDPIFAGSVVFLFVHNEKGAQGVILNSREVGKIGFGQMQDIFNAAPGTFAEAKDMILNGKLQSVPLFLGGPCQTPGIIFLHGHEEFLNIHEGQEQGSEYDLGIPDSFNLFGEDEEKPAYQDDIPSPVARMKIIEGLYFGSPFTFGHLIEAGKLDENKFRFFTGLSAWSAGQLEYEVQSGAWTVVDATPDVFFNPEELNKLVQSVADKQPPADPSEPPASKSKHSWVPKTPPGFDPSWN
jgi:putative transcriptional regulator